MRIRASSELAQLCSSRVVFAGVSRPIEVGAPTGRPDRWVLHLVNENVDAGSLFDQLLTGTSVAGDHDAAIGRVDAIAERIAPRTVIHAERADTNTPAVVDHARLNLVNRDSISARRLMLESSRANPDVFTERRVQVIDHAAQSRWTVQTERLGAPEYPRREDEIGETQHVIAVQV